MSTAIRRKQDSSAVSWPPSAAESRADPAWSKLYRVGGVCAFAYVALSLVVPTLMVLRTQYDFVMGGADLLEFIALHRTWWLVLQSLVLGSSLLAIVVFMALFVALKHVERSYAAVGATLAITIQILFIAYYPVVLGLTYLSDQYSAVSGAQRAAYVAAAEALIAQNNAFNPIYELAFAIGILLVSLVMWRGDFSRGVAYLGVATTVAAFVAVPLWPLIGVGYFWWWLVFVLWFVAVGWQLFQLGRS